MGRLINLVVAAQQAPTPIAPLVLVSLAGVKDRAPGALVEQLTRTGAVVYTTHGAGGCLRVATSVGVDVIYLDPRLPPQLLQLLKAHPTSARATVRWLDVKPVRVLRRL